jgi:small-conductance mechanosensitive channel
MRSGVLIAVMAALLLPAAQAATAMIPGLAKPEAPAAEVAESQSAAGIPIAEIPQRIERDQQKLEEIITRSSGFDSHNLHKAQLDSIKRYAGDLMQQQRVKGMRQMTLSGLKAQDRHLDFLNQQLQSWQAGIGAASKPLSDDAATLAALRADWRQTIENDGGNLVPVMRERIELLLADLERVERMVSGPLTALLKLGSEAAEAKRQIVSGRSMVQDRINAIDRGLWQLDSDSLFKALREPNIAKQDAGKALSNGLQAELTFMQEYDSVHQNRTNAVMVLSLLLLPLFLWLSRQAKAGMLTDSGLAMYRQTLTRPVSAWLLLTIMFLVMLQFNGPALRLKLLLILAWLPIMRLLSGHLKESVGRWIYLSAAFYLVNLVSEVLSGNPLLYRLILLANDCLILLALAVLLRMTIRRLKAERSPLLLALQALASLGMALVAIAIIANAAGNVSLASMLTDAMLDSAYLGLFLFAVGMVVRAFCRFLLRSPIEKLKSQTNHAGSLMHVASRLFNLALIIAWVYGVLDSFRLLRPLQALFSAFSSISLGFGNVSVTIGGILLFVVSVYLSFWLAKTIRSILAEDILPNIDLPRGVANSVSSLSYYAILLFGLLLALVAAGFEMSQLTLILGALSVGIGLGLQDVVKNFVSGLILMVERPVQPGDIAEVSGTIGRVRDIGMRSTTLTTFEGADVIVPNGMLLSEKMINWTLSSDQRRIDIAVGVGYGTDPKRALEVLLNAAASAEGVAAEPSPTVVFSGFGQSALEFSVRAWTDNYDDAIFVRSALAVNIHAALTEAGIAIPFPQRDLHIVSVSPEARASFTGGTST